MAHVRNQGLSAETAPHTRGRDSEPGIVELCETHARMPVDIARWTAAGLPDHATGKVVGWLNNDARFPSGKTYMRGDLILD